MSTNIFNETPFLPTSREFPHDRQDLPNWLNRMYIDLAEVINARTIGEFAVTKPAVTGDAYYLDSKKRQVLRKVFTFSAAGNISTGINPANIVQSVKGYGVFTDGTNEYGVLMGSSTAIAGQISFYLDKTISTTDMTIVVLSGAGAPTISSGTLVLEWISRT